MGDGQGEGEGNIIKLENQIAVIKYVLLFSNAITWMIGAAVFALSMWLRFEPGIQDWLDTLDATDFYIGIYVLIFASIIIMVCCFVGCLSALQENTFSLLFFVGTQVAGFIFALAGAAVLLDNSARDSRFQPRVRESMRRLIINSHYDKAQQTLAMIQQNIGCCGADGPHDFLSLQQPLPSECRDPITGNPFYHGCVDELTWFFEQKCAWLAGLAMVVCFFHVVHVVISVVLIQALKKEEDQAEAYRK